MIYVDEIREYASGSWCHMWTDGSRESLDEFAASIGLRKEWSQMTKSAFLGEFYHYDLRPNKRALALRKGAVAVSMREYLKPYMKAAK